MLIQRNQQCAGFSLIEMAMVLVVMGLIAGIGLQATSAFLSNERRRVTTARLAGLDTAFANYVAQNRRLPCPANGIIAAGLPTAGMEQRNVNGTCPAVAILNGVVPWVTLGVSESDAQDGWSNRITYRTVAATAAPSNVGFTSDQALDMTNCDPAGTAPRVSRTLATQPVMTCVQNAVGTCDLAHTTTCTSPFNYLANRGLQVQDGLGVVVMDPVVGNGAAYVLISHGDNGFGAYSSQGVLQAANGSPAGTGETLNRNNLAIQPFYVDALLMDGAVATHFDDILSRPSLMTLISKAQLGPRAHLQ